MKCVCPCGKEFTPKRSNQIYLSGEHRQRDKNRRWPVKRQSVLPVASRNGLRKRRAARTSGVTPLLGTEMAQTESRTLLIATGAFGIARPPRKALLTTAEVADFLRLSTWTIKWWRKQRTGPPYIRVGARAIRYPWGALVGYLQGNLFQPASERRRHNGKDSRGKSAEESARGGGNS